MPILWNIDFLCTFFEERGYTIENRSNEILHLNIIISTDVYMFLTWLKTKLLPDFENKKAV